MNLNNNSQYDAFFSRIKEDLDAYQDETNQSKKDVLLKEIETLFYSVARIHFRNMKVSEYEEHHAAKNFARKMVRQVQDDLTSIRSLVLKSIAGVACMTGGVVSGAGAFAAAGSPLVGLGNAITGGSRGLEYVDQISSGYNEAEKTKHNFTLEEVKSIIHELSKSMNDEQQSLDKIAQNEAEAERSRHSIVQTVTQPHG